MKITDHRNNRILFETVEVGEVFMWEGSFWMRTRPCIVYDISCNKETFMEMLEQVVIE